MSKTFISSCDLIKDIRISNIITCFIRDALNNLYFIIYLTILKLVIKEACNPLIRLYKSLYLTLSF
jgi:hypothetical protein